MSGGVCTVLGFCGKLRSLRNSGSIFMAVEYGGVQHGAGIFREILQP